MEIGLKWVSGYKLCSAAVIVPGLVPGHQQIYPHLEKSSFPFHGYPGL